MEELAVIQAELADLYRAGVTADDPRLEPLMTRHRAWLAKMWGRDCPVDAYAGLSSLFTEHSDYLAQPETLAPGIGD